MMQAEDDMALLLLIWLGTFGLCLAMGLLNWIIYQHYRRKRLARAIK